MSISVQVTGILEHLLDQNPIDVELPENATTRDLIHLLSEKYDNNFSSLMLDYRKELRPIASVLVDGRDVEACGGLDAPIQGQPRMKMSIMLRLGGIAGG